jgi:hypothetical protein
MYKKVIKYEDYNGQEREEEFYFNINRAELAKMNFDHAGSFEEYCQRLIESRNVQELYALFEKLITMSYGRKSLDGKQFIKNEEYLKEFTQSEAYAELITEFLTVNGAASDFINGILADTLAKIERQNAANGTDKPQLTEVVQAESTVK